MDAIALCRRLVHELIDGPLATFAFLPGSLEELPCYVVGRPTVVEGTPRAIIEVSTPVFVCGRTLRDDEAQAELDRYADLIVTRLWQPPRNEGIALRLTRMDPVTVTVAGTEVPAYQATVVAELAAC